MTGTAKFGPHRSHTLQMQKIGGTQTQILGASQSCLKPTLLFQIQNRQNLKVNSSRGCCMSAAYDPWPWPAAVRPTHAHAPLDSITQQEKSQNFCLGGLRSRLPSSKLHRAVTNIHASPICRYLAYYAMRQHISLSKQAIKHEQPLRQFAPTSV